MSGAIIRYEELPKYLQEMLTEIQWGFPTEYYRFLQTEARSVRARLKRNVSKSMNKITGNYIKGIAVGKVYDFGNTKSIRVYGRRPPANHTHLVELGHDIKKRGKDKKKRAKRGTSPLSAARKYAKATYEKTGNDGRTRAFLDYEKERRREQEVFVTNFEHFYNKLLSAKGYS